MSFFRKLNRDGGRFFRKNISNPVGGFFRKGGGLDDFSSGLRKSGNTLQQIGGGIRQFSSNPLVMAGADILGSAYGIDNLGRDFKKEGKIVGENMRLGGDVFKLGSNLTNRNTYNRLERV